MYCSTEWQLRGLPHAHAGHTLQNPKDDGDSDTTAKTGEIVPGMYEVVSKRVFISVTFFSGGDLTFRLEPIETELFLGPHLKFESAVVSLSLDAIA